MLKIYGVILEVIGELKPVIGQLERCDADLARQMRRAMCSVALNTAEGMGTRGKLRNVRYHSALGSMQRRWPASKSVPRSAIWSGSTTRSSIE
jgi:hypothetical protein